MKFFNIIKNDYFKLFVRREGVVVLGKNYSNLWLLTLVLVATFLAIAFSSGSINYLDYKMNDPFINWVDIQNEYGEGDFEGLSYALTDPETMEEFHYRGFQSDYKFSYFFFGREEDNTQYLNCRFFGQMNNQLVQAILDADNVVGGNAMTDLSELSEKAIGVVVTKEAMDKLGYAYPYPAYIDLYSYSPGADEYGIELDNALRARTPLPVLGVVKRLPGNVDLISSSYFYAQRTNDFTHPFNLAKEEYGRSLKFFVPSDIALPDFETLVSGIVESTDTTGCVMDPYGFFPSEQVNFKSAGGEGVFIQFETVQGEFSYATTAAVASAVAQAYPDADIHRLYDYGRYFGAKSLNTQAYISVHFNDLNNIRAFESFVNQYQVKIEMSQINAKENFNAVRIMANILSWAMIAFAIICIILFIVNLLQSYFQKVKRNLGTFKAFGISNSELISIYMLIMISIVTMAIVVSLLVVAVVQMLLPLFNVLKDGEFSYLALWNAKTIWSVLIIICASVFTVFKVMSDMLKQTPGDLIYDRQ